MSKFPLCEEAGLKVREFFAPDASCRYGERLERVIHASEVEAMLAQAVVVRGTKQSNGWCMFEHDDGSNDTHQARLVGLRPIVRDTAESLLREYLDTFCEAYVREIKRLLNAGPLGG